MRAANTRMYLTHGHVCLNLLKNKLKCFALNMMMILVTTLRRLAHIFPELGTSSIQINKKRVLSPNI